MPSDPVARFAPPLFVLIWATGFIVARLVAPHADPLHFLSLRYALAVAVLALVALAVRAPWPATRRAWGAGLLAGVLLHGGYLGGVFWAVKHGLPAGIAALIAGLQPLVTGALVGPLLGERVSPRRWLGIAVGFCGALLVVAPRLGGVEGFPPLSLLVCFLGVISITLGTIWQKRTAVSADLRTNTVHIDDATRALWDIAAWYAAGKAKWNAGEMGPVPTFNVVDKGETNQGTMADIIGAIFQIETGFQGQLISTFARMNLDSVVDDVNDEILGPWAELLHDAGITRPGPLTPFMEKELLKDTDLSMDGSRLETLLDFKYEKPKITKELVVEVIESYKRMKWWP